MNTNKMTKAQALDRLNRDLEKTAESGKLPLAATAQETVPGEGNPNSEIVFIGEAAGKNEAEQRRPFVGVAGRLVNKQLVANGLQREDVYITNVVKTRPPGNRDPSPEEIAAYSAFLDKELEIIQPILVVTLGRFSMARFLPDVKISQVHGRVFKLSEDGRTFLVMPFYHPAAALRRGTMMEAFVSDFAKLPKVLEYARSKKEHHTLTQHVQEVFFDTTE